MIGFSRPWTGAILAFLLLSGSIPRSAEGVDDGIARYPSGFQDEGALREALMDPRSPVSTVLFEDGVHEFAETLLLGRDDLLIRGAGGGRGAIIQSPAEETLRVEGARGVSLRGLTIRSTAARGTALSVQAVTAAGAGSVASDVTVTACRIEGWRGIAASVDVRDLSVSRCRIQVTRPGGFGLTWEDGRGLFVGGTRFSTGTAVSAQAAIEVRGPRDPDSEGGSARRVYLARNRVGGDFSEGIHMDDVVDARVLRNRISLPGPLDASYRGRTGILLRSLSASLPVEDAEIVRNRVRRAHTGAAIADAAGARVLLNDFRGCASPAADSLYLDAGCAVRILLPGPGCPGILIQGNDFRGLRSPADAPAVEVLPSGSESSCFAPDDGNRTGKGRALYRGGAR